MNKEIKEILDKLSNRKQETLIQGLRECQLKDIEHPFITREEYIDKILDYITNLQHNLEVSQTNEETYRLEMQEITKIFVLDEHTLFDDVKEYATNLQEENKKLKEQLQNKDIDKCKNCKCWNCNRK